MDVPFEAQEYFVVVDDIVHNVYYLQRLNFERDIADRVRDILKLFLRGAVDLYRTKNYERLVFNTYIDRRERERERERGRGRGRGRVQRRRRERERERERPQNPLETLLMNVNLVYEDQDAFSSLVEQAFTFLGEFLQNWKREHPEARFSNYILHLLDRVVFDLRIHVYITNFHAPDFLQDIQAQIAEIEREMKDNQLRFQYDQDRERMYNEHLRILNELNRLNRERRRRLEEHGYRPQPGFDNRFEIVEFLKNLITFDE